MISSDATRGASYEIPALRRYTARKRQARENLGEIGSE